MAVNPRIDHPTARVTAGRRFSIGANVVIATALVAGIVVFLQWIAYESSARGARWDMTSSQINSLSDATVNLLRNLDQPVTLTSLYFETDLEAEDQPFYRRTVNDLLELYQATQRSKVTAAWVNPLSHHEKFKELLARLREKPAFKDDLQKYASHVDQFKDKLDPAMRSLVQGELSAIASLAGPMGGAATQASVGQVEALLSRWQSELEATREQIDAITTTDSPQYAGATSALESTYRDFSKSLKNIQEYGTAHVTQNPSLPPQATDFLANAGSRYAELVGEIEGELTALQELEPLDFDDIVRKLTPNGNPVIVETENEALVVDFSSIWPPLDPSRGGRASFADRAFKGEEKITAAILRATHKEQTAVVFVRYGGNPLFMGGFMPGQPPAPYASMKQQLEDANFVVEEWDLKTTEAPPEIDPKPTRTIYVVLKPTPPQGSPFQQQQNPQDLPFAATHRAKLASALGEAGRALFIAGWYPGQFGPMPGTYEYNEYLEPTYGIKVDMSTLVIQTINFEVGKYGVDQGFFSIHNFDFHDHVIVRGPQVRLLTLPAIAPLTVADDLPEGVVADPLITVPEEDTIWGAKNLQTYQEQLASQRYMTRTDGDTLGPFTAAVAATKGDAKIVVISARDFAADDVAFAREFAVGPQGFTIRSRNPGNVTLLVNSLHWLNDNEEIMGIGQPIESAVLQIEGEKTVKAVQALTIFVWPALALVCGAVAWWTRRR
jgi:hypothetical protein